MRNRIWSSGIRIMVGCLVFLAGHSQVPVAHCGEWRIGLAKVDITPLEPLRLSGYSNRVESHTAIADPLHVRAMSLNHGQVELQTKPVILVSIDSILVTGEITNEIAKWLNATHSIPRSHIVLSSTHSHTAPHLPNGLDNLFKEPSTQQQVEASQRYAEKIVEAIKTAIDQSLSNTVDGVQLEIGVSSAPFAVQRRLIREGRWSGFGVQEGGQVDHRVHVLRLMSADGALLGAAYQYACHCTTLGPDFNQISGDWAGLSASRLEELNPGAVFLPIIGCGADANPEPRTSYEAAQKHSLEIVDAVTRVLRAEDNEILPPLSNVQFGLVGLEPEHPTQDRLQEAVSSTDPNEARWAKQMQQTRLTMGRLPESVPLPVHVWSFGDALSWVFMGGEVVVDYQFKIEKELPARRTWVAAYCDDVPGYIASESQRPEGGYEVDYSMMFYLQPGRWKTGTQSTILTRVREISQQDRGEDEPLDPQAALKTMIVPDDFRIDLVASEPLVQDPVNIAFGWDGRVWVVQMSDYPKGTDAGGCVRLLLDENQDGIPDRASTFLDQLGFPTSVHPWRNGVLVVAAPNILFAEDTDGDLVADQQKVLLSGIAEVNPQHRASGFEIGLDGRLHFAVGDGTRELVSHLNGQTYRVQGHDVAWNPDTGELELFVSGTTQFMPGRDAFGTWFGNHNNQPMFQFVFQTDQLNGHSVDIGNIQHLLTPPEAPPVFPRSRTVDRFNDLYTRDRYTSACAAMIVRNPALLAPDSAQDLNQPTGLVCEPVHNLVARIQLRPHGSVFSAQRHSDDIQFDFLASTDPWSRPVRAINAPDGTIWVLDMYRYVIEHPQWIPTAWQRRINVRAGEGLGRIYRVYHHQFQPGVTMAGLKTVKQSLDLSKYDPIELLTNPVGALRDLATQAIVTNQITRISDQELEKRIRKSLSETNSPEVQASLLGVLAGKKWLQQSDLAGVLTKTSHSGLAGWALKLAAGFPTLDEPLKVAIEEVPSRGLGGAVDLQWVLGSKSWINLPATKGLIEILNRGQPDQWLGAALTLLDSPQTALPIVKMILEQCDTHDATLGRLDNQLGTLRRLLRLLDSQQKIQIVKDLCSQDDSSKWPQSRTLLLVGLRGIRDSLTEFENSGTESIEQQLDAIVERAVDCLLDANRQRQQREVLSLLMGSQALGSEEETSVFIQLLEQGGVGTWLSASRLRYLSSDSPAEELLSRWSQLDNQGQALAAGGLMTRKSWRESLMSRLETGAIEPGQLPTAVVHGLLTNHDRNLRSRAVAVFGRPSPRQTIVTDYLNKMPNPNTHGDPERGSQLYRDHCAVCHTGQDGRTAIGPPLENLAQWNNTQWITALLDPSQTVEDKYMQSVILTTDEEVLAGIVVDETSRILRIAGSDGVIKQIEVADVQDRKQTGTSLMPDGFELKITPEQAADIIYFLRTR